MSLTEQGEVLFKQRPNHLAARLPLKEMAVFPLLLAVGLALEFVGLPQISDKGGHLYRFVDHMVVTMFAATALGLTYELGIYYQRKWILREALTEFSSQLLAIAKAMTPTQLFALLADIASSPQQIPTLYYPRGADEYNFLKDRTSFDRLMLGARPDAITVLRTWLEPKSHRNVKFLATDLVGYYRLAELGDQLRDLASNAIQSWNEQAPADRPWLLNALWAASRCEDNAYEWLSDVLARTHHADIQEWILFVPRQMDDPGLLPMVRRFLKENQHIGPSALEAAAVALATLQRRGHDAQEVVAEQSDRFRTDAGGAALKKAWESADLDFRAISEAVGRYRHPFQRRRHRRSHSLARP